MIPPIYNDVLAAVGYVESFPTHERRAAFERLMADADSAESYARAYKAAHPVFGDGTLLSAALRCKRKGATSFRSRSGLDAWCLVLNTLRTRMDQPDAQLMRRVTVGSNSKRLTAMSFPQSSQ